MSRTIDKALGGMQESSEDEAQNNHPANSVQNSSTEASNDTHEDPTHSPPEWVSTWPSQTASAKSLTNEEKAIPDKTTTFAVESEKVVAGECLSPTGIDRESSGREGRRGEGGYREEVDCCKCSSRGGRYEDETHTNTKTVQQDVPRDVGPSAIGRRAKARRILGWCQLASGSQMRWKTQVFRLLRTRSFTHRIFDRIFQQWRQGVAHGNPRRPMQCTPGNLVRSLECLSKCCHTFNPTCDQEEGDC